MIHKNFTPEDPSFLLPDWTVAVRWDGLGWYVEPMGDWSRRHKRRNPPPGVPRICPTGITICNGLERMVRTKDGFIGAVSGYWNMNKAEWLEGIEEWPFGQVELTDEMSTPPLLSCLPDGRVIVPAIPTYQQAVGWLLEKKIEAPAWECGCGAIHHGPGLVMDMVSIDMSFTAKGDEAGYGPFSVNLVAQQHEGGSLNGLIPQTVLSVRDSEVLRFVQGAPTSITDLHHQPKH